MALDGIFLHCLKTEIEQEACGMRVEKVHQPSREEILLILRGRNGQKKLLISARANSPRIHFTQYAPENPKTPPMLCMLLRKHLTGALLTGLRQVDLDRILFLDFDASNEIGDRVKLSLCVEIMAQHSNIILLDGHGVILDSLKRVDLTMSSVRQILPALPYELPPLFDKFNLLNTDIETVADAVLSASAKKVSAAVLAAVQGVSPIVSREIAYRACGEDIACGDVTQVQRERLTAELAQIKASVQNSTLAPYVVKGADGQYTDFAFLNITQYGGSQTIEKTDSFCALLDQYYYERDRFDRMRQRTNDVYKMLTNAIARISKKINLQRTELAQCADRDALRISAELISANQYQLQKGAFYYDLPNYYDENKILRIKADPALSPAENSQKYYKEYRKAKTAEQMLSGLIEQNEQELSYIESVLDELTRCDTQAEFNEIRSELADNGYGKAKNRNAKGKKEKPLPCRTYLTDDGYTVLVGRNNVQNDMLTFKTARHDDVWLHTKNIPGSHTVILAQNGKVSDLAIEQASVIAAYHSKARNSSQVPVDYTIVKNLKKPPASKPGKVIYHVYYTILANPAQDLVERLEEK